MVDQHTGKFRPLTMKERRLIEALPYAKTNVEAAKIAGYSGTPDHLRHVVNRVLSRPKVQEAAESVWKELGLDEKGVFKRLRDIILEGHDRDSLRGIEIYNKLRGLYPARQETREETSTMTRDLSSIPTETLKKELKEIKREINEVLAHFKPQLIKKDD